MRYITFGGTDETVALFYHVQAKEIRCVAYTT